MPHSTHRLLQSEEESQTQSSRIKETSPVSQPQQGPVETDAKTALRETARQDPGPVIKIATRRNWVALLSLMTVLPA